MIRTLTGVGNAAVSFFCEPVVKFGTATAKRILDTAFGEGYVPPIYDLRTLEAHFSYKYYPQKAPYHYEKPGAD